MIGKTIVHYRIMEKLGEGGMGVVYKAHDINLDRTVAIKFLPKSVAANSKKRERFKIEAKAAAALNHPNIATIHAIEEHDDELFIVMEYIEGPELKNLIHEIPPASPLKRGATASSPLEKGDQGGLLPIEDVIYYAIQIGEGLQAAHEKGIVHRDIKTSNIMITDKGQVKIMDFGLARVGEAVDLTKNHSTLGTAAYMSPEQARGGKVDHRTDIWAFGVVLYEMLTGVPPFKGDYEQAVIYSILNEEPQSLTEIREDIPEALGLLVNRALAKDANQRYQQIEELISDLIDTSESERVRLPNRRLAGALKKTSKIKRFGIGASIFLILFLLSWVLFEFGSNSSDTAKIPSRTVIAVLPFSAHGASEFDYLGEGMVNLLSTKLDGAGELRSVDPRALLSFVNRKPDGVLSPEEGHRVAQHFDAGLFVMGDIVEAGRRLQINTALYEWDQEMRMIAEISTDGEAEQIFEIVDKLATQLLTRLTGKSGTRVTHLASVTTDSLPAIKAYLEGESALRKGEFESAVEAFQRAVSIDSLFALAYYRLSIAAEWLIRPKIAHSAAQLAFQHGQRLSPRDRRLLEALFAYREGKAQQAEELYRSLLGTHPDDVEAWIQLGEVLFHYNPLHGQSFSEAREPFERVLFYEPEHTASLIHLARIAAADKKSSELDSLVKNYVNLYPSGGRILPMTTLRAFSQQSPHEQEQIMRQLVKARDEDIALAVWDVALYAENLKGAEELTRILAESPRFSSEVHFVAKAWLAHLKLAKGQWRLAKQELSNLEQLDFLSSKEYLAVLANLPFLPLETQELAEIREALFRLQPGPTEIKNPSAFFVANSGLHQLLKVYLAGLLSSRLGDLNQAAQYAKQVVQIETPPGAGSLASDLALSIQAHIDLQNGHGEEALANLKKTKRETWYELMLSSPFYSQAYERFMLAELLFELGREKEALGWYTYLAATSPFEVVYIPISYLRRGQIYEKLGDHKKAVENYTRFVDLWQDCDPELRPMLEKAQQRLDETGNLAKR